jgi:hypothetical protein
VLLENTFRSVLAVVELLLIVDSRMMRQSWRPIAPDVIMPLGYRYIALPGEAKLPQQFDVSMSCGVGGGSVFPMTEEWGSEGVSRQSTHVL